MKLRISLSIMVLFFIASCAPLEEKANDVVINETSKYRSPSSFFPDEKPKVLVVGTFHFDYPGLDAYKTAEEDKVDVLTPKRQEEMDELIAYLKQFKPNKIAIEATEKWGATAKLRQYNEGALELGRGERYQIGIRMASELQLDTLYAIDAGAFINDIYSFDTTFFNN